MAQLYKYILRAALCLFVCIALTASAVECDTIVGYITPRTGSADVRVYTEAGSWGLKVGQIGIEVKREKFSGEIYPFASTINYTIEGMPGRKHVEKVYHKTRGYGIRFLRDANVCRLYGVDGREIGKEIGDVLPYAQGAVQFKTNTSEEPIIHTQLLDRYTLGHSPVPLDGVAEYLKTTRDSIEGVWEYYDSEIDEGLADLSGPCRYYILKNDAGGYDIVYSSGMRLYPSAWEPGMVRGRLQPTVVDGQFDLQWLDATCMMPLGDENYAVNEKNIVLRLCFPLLNSKVRLRRAL